ncbi:MAG: hypothetical protein ACRD2O_17125, partial [Terriglobia bacterium]
HAGIPWDWVKMGNCMGGVDGDNQAEGWKGIAPRNKPAAQSQPRVAVLAGVDGPWPSPFPWLRSSLHF